MSTGLKFVISILFYHGVMVVAYYLDKLDIRRLQLFSLLISVFMVFPDWVLSRQFDVLVFPEDGLPQIDTVAIYMLALWSLPATMIVLSGELARERGMNPWLIVSLTTLIVFIGSEATLWVLGSWYAQNVFLIGHLALYIIIPELIFGLLVYIAFLRQLDDPKSFILSPPLIALIYTIASSGFLLLFQVVLPG